jgi:hypothetical protein
MLTGASTSMAERPFCTERGWRSEGPEAVIQFGGMVLECWECWDGWWFEEEGFCEGYQGCGCVCGGGGS